MNFQCSWHNFQSEKVTDHAHLHRAFGERPATLEKHRCTKSGIITTRSMGLVLLKGLVPVPSVQWAPLAVYNARSSGESFAEWMHASPA